MITVVGLGFNENSITKRGMDMLLASEMIISRTLRTPPSKSIAGLVNGSFDYLYDKAEDFDELNRTIASELIRLSESYPNLVYCVDGDGYKDSSVAELSKLVEIQIIPGPFDLAINPSTSCLYLSAYERLDSIYPDPETPICVYAIDDAEIASEVKLFLLKFYSPEEKVALCTAKSKTYIELVDLDRQKAYGTDTAIYVEKGNNSSFADLLRIMTRLTAPNGCPWDKAQTHESIRINLLEEAYETVQAITDENIDGMIEELGDVLLQVVFHCDIALRSGEFTLEDVIKGLNDKLVGRHTHIFGSDKADSESGALSVWENNKMKEKHQQTFSAAVNDVPDCFPALLRAQKVAKRVEKGGLRRSLDELKSSLVAYIDELVVQKNDSKKDELLGKAFLALAWIAHHVDVSGEQALLDTVTRLQKKYTAFEKAVIKDGLKVNELNCEQAKKYFDGAVDESV
ncbi:MAG: MazG family protein [Clostridia bacterium]|nr:MazG family protein [Clostridia bacterium]